MTETAHPGPVRVPPQPTTPEDLPDALRALWQSACDDGGDIARAVTVNFVAVAKASDDAVLQGAADRLMRRSPARAFLLSIDDSRTSPAAEVAAVIRCSGRTRDVMLEEIRVRLPRSWFSHVPGLVRPLLINDVPTHLYWADDWRKGDRDFDAMRVLADHCVVDSRRFLLPAVRLGEIADRRGSGRPITDLSWLRLRPWRRALAEGFERVQWRAGLRVEGVVRHGRNGAAAAILLAQWLESKLGGRIALEESSIAGQPWPESASVRFAGHDIEVVSSARCLSVQVSTPDRCYLPFRLPCSSGSDGDLVAAAIDIA